MVNPITPAGQMSPEQLLLEKAGSSGDSLLQRLGQLGQFRAQVVMAEGRQVLLDTAFGQLRGQLPASPGQTAARLQPGDQIEARLDPSGRQPVLNIRSHQPLQQTLRQTELYQRLQSVPGQTLAARVIGQDSRHSLLQIGREQFTLPRSPQLQTGDTVLLRPGSQTGEVRLQRVQPLPLLRQALSRLLPRQQAPDQAAGSGLPRLQQLARQLLGSNEGSTAGAPARATGEGINARLPRSGETAASGARPASPGASSSPPGPQAAGNAGTLLRASVSVAAGSSLQTDARPPATADASVTRETAQAPTQPRSGSETPSRLQNLLQPLLRLAVNPQQLTPQQLQRALAELGLASGSSPPSGHGGTELLPRLVELQALLRDQPRMFEQLLREHFSTSSPQTGREASTISDWPQWRQQFSQQLDQSINQLLLGKTGLRLQQEQQQPVNTSLVVPLQLPNEPERELKLRLRGRSNPDNPEQPAWEVRLSFEFGLLGLITVHVLLQEERISAHFWAVEERTWRLIDEQLPSFRQQLLRSGFQPGLFDCFQGQPKTDDDPPHAGGDNLLDIQV